MSKALILILFIVMLTISHRNHHHNIVVLHLFLQANLISGFRATGMYPVERNEVLKRMPQEQNLDERQSIESMDTALIDMLKERKGETKKTAPRGKKLAKYVPGSILEPSDFVDDAASTSAGPSAPPGLKRKDAPSKKKAKKKCPDKSTIENAEDWFCYGCAEEWVGEDDDGNRWITCDGCSDNYHLQCSGIEYREEEYYDIDLDNRDYFCVNCDA